jgi:molybdate transport system substrate-binding protein
VSRAVPLPGVPSPLRTLAQEAPRVTGRVPVWLAAASLAVVAAACGSAGDGGDAPGEVSGELLVFAAASLADAFDELRAAFVAEHPDVEVVVNHAGSQRLASQINEGAPADVFASANSTQMDAVADEGNLVGDPQVFTANLLGIAVEHGNPLGISGLDDLADPDLVLVLPAEEVPAGQYARAALDAAGVDATPASLEQDVRAALSKVELGEADVSIVYISDLVASDAAEGVEIPVEQNVPASYPIAVLADAPNPPAAAAFVAFVLSEEGQDILAAYGFASP